MKAVAAKALADARKTLSISSSEAGKRYKEGLLQYWKEEVWS